MTRAMVLIGLLAAAGCGSANTIGSSAGSTSVIDQLTTTDLVVGTGATAATGDMVTVAYGGWLYDTSKPDGKGSSFDSNPNFPFLIGGNVIAGWNQGVPGMKVGGQRRLIIPPSLAYGPSGNSAIPPNASLVFDITLKSIP